MILTVLGSGAFAPPRPSRYPSSIRNPAGYAVEIQNEILLFDFGFGNLRQMVRARLDPVRVSHVFFSHRHPDHVGDLPALLFFFRYEAPPKKRSLTLWGPRGMKPYVQGLLRLHSPWLKAKRYRLRVRELAPPGLAAGKNWILRTSCAVHPTPSLSLRLESGGKSLCYSGDTGETPNLSRLAQRTDLLLIECTQPTSQPFPGHLSPPQALSLIRESRARRALLCHLSPESERELKRRRLPPRISLAKDLQRIVL
ncbi:MAG: MBL fold metallo-hydrolase [Elusimicrobia bacterium]|nr:MBL fold metallo-hydrolase [Elusimicrobiota bacterium]